MTRRCNHHGHCDAVDLVCPGTGHCYDPDCESPTAETCPYVNAGRVYTFAGLLRPGAMPSGVDHTGHVGSSTPPIACWACGRDFSIGYVEGGEPVVYHALPLCSEFEAVDTVAEAARFSEKCRLAQNPPELS
jgi:hypothetical protein